MEDYPVMTVKELVTALNKMKSPNAMVYITNNRGNKVIPLIDGTMVKTHDPNQGYPGRSAVFISYVEGVGLNDN